MEAIQNKMNQAGAKLESMKPGQHQGTDSATGMGTGSTNDPNTATHNLGEKLTHPGKNTGTGGSHAGEPGIKDKVTHKVDDVTRMGNQKVEDIKHR
mmetsp:Transcript_21370/g.36748  ORF Transcript_21370/g.36748 Transcript_21370/m.36748 type:complete len:96 (-) Transcript_21370:160-447(-)|eukprot:CAMPEP_0184699700 /NCGR_PEP_ID=MMETSP0313-20130426/5875_1 /TAXON_ID=2792 /ORGANISM="Porphyridium aerugineum, Strain SAG 1380-2" /LENGTH=95 /DNA_ID=CAMNT_0027158823 /DNA_START=157 /DNA_END=444 /DNA_ORIENTATION=+